MLPKRLIALTLFAALAVARNLLAMPVSDSLPGIRITPVSSIDTTISSIQGACKYRVKATIDSNLTLYIDTVAWGRKFSFSATDTSKNRLNLWTGDGDSNGWHGKVTSFGNYSLVIHSLNSKALWMEYDLVEGQNAVVVMNDYTKDTLDYTVHFANVGSFGGLDSGVVWFVKFYDSTESTDGIAARDTIWLNPQTYALNLGNIPDMKVAFTPVTSQVLDIERYNDKTNKFTQHLQHVGRGYDIQLSINDTSYAQRMMVIDSQFNGGFAGGPRPQHAFLETDYYPTSQGPIWRGYYEGMPGMRYYSDTFWHSESAPVQDYLLGFGNDSTGVTRFMIDAPDELYYIDTNLKTWSEVEFFLADSTSLYNDIILKDSNGLFLPRSWTVKDFSKYHKYDAWPGTGFDSIILYDTIEVLDLSTNPKRTDANGFTLQVFQNGSMAITKGNKFEISTPGSESYPTGHPLQPPKTVIIQNPGNFSEVKYLTINVSWLGNGSYYEAKIVDSASSVVIDTTVHTTGFVVSLPHYGYFTLSIVAINPAGESGTAISKFDVVSDARVSDRSFANLFSIFPNPFSQSTQISFTSESAGYADISIVNLLGEQVAHIFSGELDEGEHNFSFSNTAGLPDGIYECRLRMNGRVETLPMVLLH